MAGERPHMIGSPGYSPALKYEIKLAETVSKSGGASGPSRERVKTCFEIFDALIPQLGVFQHVCKMIRDEMYICVFSTELTTTDPVQKDGIGPYLSRIPYFTIALKWINRRDERVKSLEKQLEELTAKAANDRSLRDEAEVESKKYRDQYEAQHSAFLTLQNEVESLRASLKDAKDVISASKKEREQEQYDKEFRICQLENDLSETKATVAKLAPFKKTHDGLQMKFAEPRSSFTQKWQGTIVVSKKVQLQQYLRSALHVQKQLQTMENSLMDDFDTLLLNNTSGLADPEAMDVHMMVRSRQKAFKQSIEELSNELKLLDTHILQLQSQLEVMNTVNEKEDPFLTLGNPSHPNNPFHSQEQMLNKYAAVISCSLDNCATFLPLQDGQICHNCGAQTVFCPHKKFSDGIVIPLPPSVTHIKLSHPLITISTDESVSNVVQSSTSSSQVIPDYNIPDFNRIRELISERCPSSKRLPRMLTEEHVMAVVEIFYASLLRQDALISSDDMSSDAVEKTAMDAFISFMIHRYGNITDAAQCAMHNLLSTVETLYKTNKHVLLFAQQLCQFIDCTAFRYVLCLTELIFILPWRNVREFELFSKVLYSFLEEEIVEDLVVELNSFTGSAVSPQLVVDFLVLLLLKDQEPRVNKMHAKLTSFQMRVPEYMSETEYLMAVDQLAPGIPDKLTHHLFMQTANIADNREDQKGILAPVKNLACVSAYLSVKVEMSNFAKKLEEIIEGGISSGRLPPKDSWTVWNKPPFFSGIDSVTAKASVLKNYET